MKLLKNISKTLGLPFGSIKPFPELSEEPQFASKVSILSPIMQSINKTAKVI